MKARKFNNYMHIVNGEWAAGVLGMSLQRFGPDLVGERATVKLKFTLKEFPKRKYPESYTVFEHQMAYANNGKAFYWGLGVYNLDRPVSQIKTLDSEKLESMVTERRLYLVVFDWIKQYSPSKTSGKTKISEWEHTFRYAKLKDIPQVIREYEVEKGLVLITEGVNEKDFDFNIQVS